MNDSNLTNNTPVVNMCKTNIVCGESCLRNGNSRRTTYRILLSTFLLLFLCTLISFGADSSSVVLISTNDTWKYNDDGVDLGTAWRGLSYDDSQWQSGQAEFGYGDGDEVTTNKWGPDENNKYPTYYYRKTINITNLVRITNFVCNFVRDDGIVVYVNGVLAFFNNFPDGTTQITYNTYANLVSAPEESQWFTTNISKNLFVEGQNVIAVEIHQCDSTSTDISFNLALIAQIGPNLLPKITLVQQTNNSFY
ncbi:MAG TPA: hypothetical protein PLW02_12590, partial [Verrucomicrobiota bacterium]|nr:hypothetical protein [Verrucomicrobiota bacterium]